MKLYAYLWAAWIVAFLAIELSALFTGHPERTLSDFVWRGEHSGFVRYFIAAFCVWLSFHMVFKWWR